jgi:hypothetical protein
MSAFTKKIGVSVAVMCLAGATALASSVHLKPPNSNPTFIDQGLTLDAIGALAGLGSGDVVVSLTATANPTATCTNPGSGATQPPGQNPASVTVTGSEAIPADEIKNGNVSFDVTTKAPTSPIPGAPGCPNSSWTETITDLAFTSATITVQQGGVTELTVNCTFATPTTNGTVRSSLVSCRSS